MLKPIWLMAGCLSAVTLAAGPALSQTTVQTTFNVNLTINAECKIVSATDLLFPAVGLIVAEINSTSTINVQCTNGTPYTLGLGAGTGSGATVAVRKMTGTPSGTLNYSLYTTVGHTTVWGDVGAARQSGTGNSASQPFTVFGNVPVQTTPTPGAYADLVTVTLTY